MRKYTIALLGDFKKDSWIFDPLHHLKIFLLQHCNTDAHITCDVDGEVLEINDCFDEQSAHFIGQISNGNNVILDRLVEFIMEFCVLHKISKICSILSRC